jgi:excisionase family DNA binding protein
MYRPPITAGDVKPKLMTRHAAARILGDIHLRTVDRLIKAGKIRGVKVGSRALVVADSVDQLIADGE